MRVAIHQVSYKAFVEDRCTEVLNNNIGNCNRKENILPLSDRVLRRRRESENAGRVQDLIVTYHTR